MEQTKQGMEHTPEPWWAGGIGFPDDPARRTVAVYGRVAEGDQSGPRICECRGPNAVADADFIAAAPETKAQRDKLLAALTLCRGQWIHSVNNGVCLAAIAQATEGGGA